jgi:hypothetical protein
VIRIEQDPRTVELLEEIARKLDRLIDDSPERTYCLREAALALGMTYQTALECVRRGDLRYIDKGSGRERRSYVITQSAIDEFKEARSRGGAREPKLPQRMGVGA